MRRRTAGQWYKPLDDRRKTAAPESSDEDFKITAIGPDYERLRARGWWRVDAYMKTYISFRAVFGGREYRFYMRPTSTLSNPDHRLFEKVLMRESLLMEQDTGAAAFSGKENLDEGVTEVGHDDPEVRSEGHAGSDRDEAEGTGSPSGLGRGEGSDDE